MFEIKVKEDTEALEKRMTALKWLAEHQVDIGLPDGAPERSRMILAIQEHGSPVMRIPPRPVIKPALAKGETREAMAEAMQGALAAAQEGDLDGAMAGMEACGKTGVHGGWIYNRVAKKGVFVEGKGFDKPLYDTGELYESFGYEIKDRD